MFAQNKMELMGRRKKADIGSRHVKHTFGVCVVSSHLLSAEKSIAVFDEVYDGLLV